MTWPFSPLARKRLRDLWHIRAQVLAIAVITACGVAVAIMSYATLQSLKETRQAYYERHRFAHVFAHLERAPERRIRDVAAIPGVQFAEGRIVEHATLDIAGMAEPATGRLVSLPSALNALALRQGRLPEPDRNDEVVVSETMAAAHGFHPGSRLNAVINGRHRTLVVAGIALSPEYIYSLGPGQLMPDDKRFGIIWMNRDALAAAFDMERAVNDIILTLLPGSVEAEVIRRLDALLDDYGGTGAYGRDSQLSDAFLDSELDQLAVTGTVLPPIFLGVAVFLLNVSVTRMIEREREQIGLLKAFGYRDLTIGAHYMITALTIAFLGVALGIGGGIWLAELLTRLYTEFYRFPLFHYRTDPAIVAASALFALALAAAACLNGVRQAVVIAPAVAMAPPTPPSYRTSRLEQLAPLKHLKPAGRMILRHLTRWPVRAALTILGLACSVAILVGTLFFHDAVDDMINSHFFNAQRHNVAVTFTAIRPARALDEIKALDGVMAVEPIRTVPVRLRLGNRESRTQLTGLVPSPTLHRLIGENQRPLAMPPHGLVLTDHLAATLGAQLGDRVTVEVLEGRRPDVTLPVAALGGEYIGKPAYMELSALNRLMGDPAVLSGAVLQVEPSRQDSLFRALKALPAVAGVSLRDTSVRAFRDTMEETINIMLSFYLAFGAVIAGGTVYNSARISLSERGRDLAAMRVLGFTRAEVSLILLGEMAIQTLASLPLGFGLGYGLAATLSAAFETELYRIPLVVAPDTYGLAAATVTGAAVVAGLLVRRRVDSLDLIRVLKTRE